MLLVGKRAFALVITVLVVVLAMLAPAGTGAAADPAPGPAVTSPAVGQTSTESSSSLRRVRRPAVLRVSPSSGPTSGGTRVVVRGQRLQGATTVLFGAAEGTQVRVRSPRRLTVVAPARTAGTVPVRVVTPRGTSPRRPSARFTYLRPSVGAPEIVSVSPSSGPSEGGTTVTVNGSNLGSATQVLFGSAPGTEVDVRDGESLTVVSPPGAGSVDLRVVTPAGTSPVTSATRFRYVETPTVASVTPSSGPVGGGTTVVLTGAGLAEATQVVFGGTPGTGLTARGNELSVVTPAAASAGTVDVRVTTPAGTSAPSATARFTYASTPRVVSINPPAGPQAGGTTITVSGSDFSGATQVLFDDVPGTGLVVQDDGQLTVVTPAAGLARAVDVRVVTPAGTSPASPGARFTYLAPSVPAPRRAAAAVAFPNRLAVYLADTDEFVTVPTAGSVDDYDLDAEGRISYDQGANGLARFDPVTGLSRLVSSVDVSTVSTSPGGLVYYTIRAGAPEVVGTYVYDPDTDTSTRFTSELATDDLVALGSGVAFGQFPSGLRRYDPATGLFELVSNTGGIFDAAGDDTTVYAVAGGNLVRFRRTSAGSYDQTVVTNNLNVISFDVSESGQVYLDLSVNGTWLYDGAADVLSRIDTRNPVFVVADQAGNAYFDYAGNGGTTRYVRATGSMTVLSTNPNAFFGPDDVDATGALYMDYNGGGLWRFDPATDQLNQPFAGTRISTENPLSTVGNR